MKDTDLRSGLMSADFVQAFGRRTGGSQFLGLRSSLAVEIWDVFVCSYDLFPSGFPCCEMQDPFPTNLLFDTELQSLFGQLPAGVMS